MPYIGHSPTNAGSFIEIDDFSSTFNGAGDNGTDVVAFTLQVGGVDITPNTANVLVMLDGVLQQPPAAYSISGSTITFTEAPASGTDLYAVLIGQSASVGQGTVGASELKVSGNGSSGQVLASDGDGTFTWTTDTEAYLPLAGGALTGAVTTNSTFDGVDIATRDGVLTSTTTTANAALPKAGGTMTGTLAMGSNDITGTGDIGGTLTTAAQANITSVGTLTGLTTSGVLSGKADATAGAPAYTFTGDTNTGIYRGGADQLQLATGGAERIQVNNSSSIFYSDVTMYLADDQLTLHLNSPGDAAELKLTSDQGTWSIFSNNSADELMISDGTTRFQLNDTGGIFAGTVISNKHMAVGAETAISSWEDTDNEFAALHLGNAASVFGSGSGTTNSQAYLATNTYYNGAWKRIGAGEASMINLNDDGHMYFFHAAADAGTAGADGAITFSQSLKLDVDGTATFAGNVGVRGAPSDEFTIHSSSGSNKFHINADGSNWNLRKQASGGSSNDVMYGTWSCTDVTFAGNINTKSDGEGSRLGGHDGGLEVRSTSANDMGIYGSNSSGDFRFQLYGGNGTDYGFLASNWGSWDIRKTKTGNMYLNNNTDYYLNPPSTSKLNGIINTGQFTSQHTGSSRFHIETTGNMSGGETLEGWNPLFAIDTDHAAHSFLVSHGNTDHWMAGFYTDGYGIYTSQKSGGTTSRPAFLVDQVNTTKFTVTYEGAVSKTSGSFIIDHPLPSMKDTHSLVHSFTESPRADLIYRDKVTLVDGSATINIDTVADMTEGTFVLLCDNVQCFTSNESDWKAVKGSVTGNILTIECEDSNSTAEIAWMVIGDRKDEAIMEAGWTDENGKPIIEPLKETSESIGGFSQ